MNKTFYRDFILVFVITATFDFLMNITPLPFGANLLREYFKHHTILAAALIAGVGGAIPFIPIAYLIDYKKANLKNMAIIFWISAFAGILMEHSTIFPVLKKHYYDKLPRYQSFLADGLSGMMVASVFWVITIPYKNRRKLYFMLPLWVSIFIINHILKMKNLIMH